jgi:glycosyltransferase involved in cell wall biosynthesis
MENYPEKQLTVSVIIPAYNAGKTIERAVKSVFAQTRLPEEVIVIDDGSTDDTSDIIKQFYPSVILLYLQNSGASAARNIGVRNAKGDLIAFLDSDDFWHCKKIEYQISLFKKFPDLGICSTNSYTFNVGQHLNYEEKCYSDMGSLSYKTKKFDFIITNPFLATPTVMLKKKLFEEVKGFNENIKTAEDVDLWLRCTYKAQYIFINNPLTFIVKQADSLTVRAGSMHEDLLNVIDLFIKTNNVSFYLRYFAFRQLKSQSFCMAGSCLVSNQSYSKAAKLLFVSFIMFPNIRALYLLSKSIFLLPKTFVGNFDKR